VSYLVHRTERHLWPARPDDERDESLGRAQRSWAVRDHRHAQGRYLVCIIGRQLSRQCRFGDRGRNGYPCGYLRGTRQERGRMAATPNLPSALTRFRRAVHPKPTSPHDGMADGRCPTHYWKRAVCLSSSSRAAGAWTACAWKCPAASGRCRDNTRSALCVVNTSA
jgi:hypothetical protein